MPDRVDPGLTAAVKKAWRGREALSGLLEAAEQVERLISHPGWIAVQTVLDRERQQLDADLDHGPPKDAPEYAKAHGRRSALGAAEDVARAILEVAPKARAEAEHEDQQRRAGESAQERTAV